MKPTPSVDKAVRYLQDLLAREGLKGGARLPAIEHLARGADVALVSMWKAVRRLADEGVLHARRGAGTHVAPAPASDAHDKLVQSVSQRLLHDVLEGRFHVDTALPSVKELCALYDIGPRTVRAAVGQVLKDGHLVKRGRDFRIRRARLSRATGASVLFIRGADFIDAAEASYFRATIERFMHHFEQQCARRNVQTCEVVVADAADASFKSSSATLGYIIWYTGSLEPFLRQIMEHCVRMGKPTVVYDLTDVSLDKLAPYSNKTIRVLHNDNFAAGRAVGNALLHRGHRHICFFAEQLFPWAGQRHAGLVSAFDKAGYRNGVQLFPGDPLTKAPRERPEVWKRADADKWFIESLITNVRGSRMNEYSKGRVASRLADAAYWSAIYCVMEKAMRDALHEKEATAWVAADDPIALHAVMPFLQAQRVQVPRDLSLAGFNNQFEAPHANLSSYHFDMTGMAMRTLTFLLYPSQERRLRPAKQATAVEGIGGFMMDRGSVAAPLTSDGHAQAYARRFL